jgi:hypothetical protein
MRLKDWRSNIPEMTVSLIVSPCKLEPVSCFLFDNILN